MSKLTYIFSSMNSGKTLALLTKNFMLKEKGFSTVLFKPAIDTRTADISSRIGLKHSCILVPEDKLISTLLPTWDVDYVLVDEAQFLTKKQVVDLSDLVDYFGVNVLCYGIKIDWQGNLFEGSKELLTLADELIQMESYCKETGNPALFHYKTGGSDKSVETGYENLYETVSRQVWKRKMSTSSKVK